MRESVKALEAGVQPVPAGGGLGGAYYFRNRHGMNIAIVKPTDEEPLAPNNPKGFVGKALGQPGLNRSIRVGETGVREVAAYLLDHDHFAKVPATALVKATHSIFNVNKVEFMGVSSQENSAVAKIGSFQQFVDHDYDASDCGTSRFPVSAVHRIGILDVRIFNTDRHAGNILVKKERERETYDYRSSHSSLRLEGGVELIPIDHGLCLPETLEDPYFEWLHWPQASFPFSEEELDYIRSLDPYKDADILRKELPMLREACLRMLVLSTTFLQKAVEAGLCLSEIGAMMSREVCGVDDAVSELEVVCMLAKAQVEQEMSTLLWDADEITLGSPLKEENSADQFQFDMDHEELSWDRLYSPKLLKSPEAKPQSCRSPQSPCAVAAFGLTDFPLHHSPCSPSAFARPRGTFRTLSVLQELQPVEEEEGLINSSKFFPASPPSPCYSTSAAVSRPFLSRCSSSFNSRTHQFPNHFEPRKRGVKKTFGSQVPQALYSAQGPSMTPVVMSDMNGEAWMLFMVHFEILVQEAFARRKCESVGRLQRLGKSCQF
ncbi:hypothetical protein O6H91_10G061100 [Diphasiastrum complanatum]|nr:hypothetical protein O6H91_10G061100 [Diphasiastrum complanatum]